MARRLVCLAIALALVVLVSCTKERAQIDPTALLGATEEEIISQLGKPDVQGEVREGLQELMYQDIHFNLMLEGNVVTACVIRDGSSVPLSDQIRCGVPIERVTEVFGAYDSEEKAQEGATAGDFSAGVLYHRHLSSGAERYQLRYPNKELLFTFYPDRTLRSVWIGKLY